MLLAQIRNMYVFSIGGLKVLKWRAQAAVSAVSLAGFASNPSTGTYLFSLQLHICKAKGWLPICRIISQARKRQPPHLHA